MEPTTHSDVSMNSPGPAEPPAAAHVYSWVRNAIATGKLVPGERYSIYGLAEDIGYSRTPVREAILRLAQLGVIDIERNRGFVVRRLSVEEVRANYESRMLLEVPAAKAAAMSTDAELKSSLRQLLQQMDRFIADADTQGYLEWDRTFHTAIVRAGGNARVEHLAGTLRDASIQTWDIYTPGMQNANRRRGTQTQHYEILHAIESGDIDRAGQAMQVHLETTALLLMRHVASSSAQPLPEEFSGCLRPYHGLPPVSAR